jgi:predicted transcriptional regulator
MNNLKQIQRTVQSSIEQSKHDSDYLVLRNEIRRKTFHEILQNPGIHTRELQRRIGVSLRTISWHVRVLEGHRIIKSVKGDYYQSFYPSTDFEENSQAKFISNGTRRNILECIGAIAGITQNEISKKIGMNQSTVLHHIKKLIREGLVWEVKDGRYSRYFIFQ